jgi:hypothetical protein
LDVDEAAFTTLFTVSHERASRVARPGPEDHAEVSALVAAEVKADHER